MSTLLKMLVNVPSNCITTSISLNWNNSKPGEESVHCILYTVSSKHSYFISFCIFFSILTMQVEDTLTWVLTNFKQWIHCPAVTTPRTSVVNTIGEYTRSKAWVGLTHFLSLWLVRKWTHFHWSKWLTFTHFESNWLYIF